MCMKNMEIILFRDLDDEDLNDTAKMREACFCIMNRSSKILYIRTVKQRHSKKKYMTQKKLNLCISLLRSFCPRKLVGGGGFVLFPP